MTIQFSGKELETGVLNGKKLEEVWFEGKKVRPEGIQPRLHDGELWFRIHAETSGATFSIPTNGYSTEYMKYDWDISVDGSNPQRYEGYSRSRTNIHVYLGTYGEHVVKVTPHNAIVPGRARVMGNGTNSRNGWGGTGISFSLEYLPLYAFMYNQYTTGDHLLAYAWAKCPYIISLPKEISLPESITTVGDDFLYNTRNGCAKLNGNTQGFSLPQHIVKCGMSFLGNTWADCPSLTTMPSGFNLPQQLMEVGLLFLGYTWYNCRNLTTMPSGFNLPEHISGFDTRFLEGTRRSCAKLQSLPKGFNLPTNQVPYDSFTSTREDCDSLSGESPASPLVFSPYPNYNVNYARNCFGGTCRIYPDTPSPGSSVMIRRNP